MANLEYQSQKIKPAFNETSRLELFEQFGSYNARVLEYPGFIGSFSWPGTCMCLPQKLLILACGDSGIMQAVPFELLRDGLSYNAKFLTMRPCSFNIVLLPLLTSEY